MIRFATHSILWITFFLITSIANAKSDSWDIHKDPFSIHIDLSSNEITLNNTLKVNLKLTYPKTYKIQPNELIDQVLWHINPLSPYWELAKKQIHAKTTESDSETTEIQLELNPLIAKVLPLSFFKITFHPSDSKMQKQEFLTPIFDIKVILPELAEVEIDKNLVLLPLEPQYPIDLSLSNREKLYNTQQFALESARNERVIREHSFPWIAFLLLLTTPVLWLLWRYYRPFNWLKKPEQPAISPEALALTHLNHLQVQELPQKGRYKEFYIALTTALRTYLEDRFKIPARAETTEEFLAGIAMNTAFPKEIQAILKQLLNRADRVKFAQDDSTIEECKEAYIYALQLIQTNQLDNKK